MIYEIHFKDEYQYKKLRYRRVIFGVIYEIHFSYVLLVLVIFGVKDKQLVLRESEIVKIDFNRSKDKYQYKSRNIRNSSKRLQVLMKRKQNKGEI